MRALPLVRFQFQRHPREFSVCRPALLQQSRACMHPLMTFDVRRANDQLGIEVAHHSQVVQSAGNANYQTHMETGYFVLLFDALYTCS